MPNRPRHAPRWLKAARLRPPDAPRPPTDFVERALSRAGVMPAREVPRALKAGRVRLAGRPVKDASTPLSPGDALTVDGQAVDVSPRTVVLMFHKPAGLVVHGHDADGPGTVFEALEAALPAELRRFGWLAVGRLDRDTTGLLLFTQDERFVAHATSPDTHLPKRYLARVGGEVTEAKLEALRRGVPFGEGVTRPAGAALRSPQHVALTLTEGKFHQVKRMLNEVHLATLQLHREAVGRLELDVPVSTFRRLEDAEVDEKLSYRPRHWPPPPAD